jgi:hypothetical protein
VGPTRQRGEGKMTIPLRVSPAGPRASFVTGPNRCPGSSFMFLFLLFFSFSEILFPLEILHNETKQGQTKF